MALRAALARPKTPIIHESRPPRSRLRASAAFVALSLSVTGLTATGTLLHADPALAAATAGSATFSNAAGETWSVPTGVTSITATVTGAAGGSGGRGSTYTGTFAVVPGQTLTIWGSTAGKPVNADNPGVGGAGYAAGAIGGGDDGTANAGGGGGGASAITLTDGSPVLVAGGGGGGGGRGWTGACSGGAGGAADAGGGKGSTARTCGGSNGPGDGGAAAGSETPTGSKGGSSARTSVSGGAGGGGGGYPTGGAGGKAGTAGGGGGGGGGGASFKAPAVTAALLGLAASTGDGSVKFSFTPSYTTTTTLSASPSSSVIGTPITFAATVTGEIAGTPESPLSGTVALYDADNAQIGAAVALVNGTATFPTLTPPLGTHGYTAAFTPAAGSAFQASPHSRVSPVTVAKSSTQTVLHLAAASAEFGEPVTATITVSTPAAPVGALPDGTVELRDEHGTVLGREALLNGEARMSFIPAELAPLQLTAFYLGNGSFAASQSVGSQLDVVKSESLLELSQSTDTTVWGESFSLVAEVSLARNAPSPNRAATAGTVPTGTVTFYADGVVIGTAGVTNGVAQIDVDDLEVGDRELSASYDGDTYFTAAVANDLDHEVAVAQTATTLAALSSAPLVGQSITLGATVSVLPNGAGTPTGSVVFTVDGVALPSVAVAGGVATLDHAFWTVGAHTVTAAFSDGTRYAASSATSNVTVAQAVTGLSLSTDVNPAVFGQAQTVSATLSVLAPGAGNPSGEIAFALDGAPWAMVPVSSGVATLPLGALAVGSYELTASYAGGANYAGVGSSIMITVEHAATELTVSADRAESSFGQSLTLHAALAVVAPGAGTPTGSIAFLADGVEIGFATLDASGAAASLTIPKALAVGARQITAHFAGDMSFAPATSAVLGHTVLTAPVGIVLNAPADSVSERDTVFSATVQPLTSTGHVPSGFVQFAVDGQPFGSPMPVGATAPGGMAARSTTDVVSARLSTSTLPVGEHVITVSYLGDGSFAAASSAAAVHLVKPKAPVDPIKPIDPLTPVVPAAPVAPSAPAAVPAGALATTGVQGLDMGIAAGLLLMAGLGMFGVGAVRLRRRSA